MQVTVNQGRLTAPPGIAKLDTSCITCDRYRKTRGDLSSGYRQKFIDIYLNLAELSMEAIIVIPQRPPEHWIDEAAVLR